MNLNRKVTLFHAPNTRSTGVLTLLEELGADYELKVLNMKAGDLRKPEYLAVNPMGKVPALLHEGALVTEQIAIYQYLADLYADRGLAPQIDALKARLRDDPKRLLRAIRALYRRHGITPGRKSIGDATSESTVDSIPTRAGPPSST